MYDDNMPLTKARKAETLWRLMFWALLWLFTFSFAFYAGKANEDSRLEAAISTKISMHSAETRPQLEAIDKRLDRLESKVDQLLIKERK